MWAIKYLFYRLYQWQVDCWKDDEVSINALVLVVMLLCLNLVTLLTLVETISGRGLLLAHTPKNAFRGGILVIAVLIGLSLYYSLIHRGNYRKIVKEFERESEHQRKTRGLGVSLYVACSIILLFAVALLRGKMIAA